MSSIVIVVRKYTYRPEDHGVFMSSLLQNRLFEILERPPAGDRLARHVNVALVLLIVLNVAAHVLETMPDIGGSAARLFAAFELVSVSIFSAEYLVRLWAVGVERQYAGLRGRLRFIFTPMALIDLLAVLPYWLPVTLDLRLLRMFRLARALRILKLGRYSSALRLFGRVMARKREELAVLVFVLLVLLLLASSVMYYVEHDEQRDAFSSIPETMWWGVITLTTIGYGDVYPITPVGRVVGAAVAILGIGMFALPAGLLGAAFMEELDQRKRKPARCPHCGKPLADAAAVALSHLPAESSAKN